MSSFWANLVDRWLSYLLWNFPPVIVTALQSREVNTGSNNDGSKPLPGPVLNVHQYFQCHSHCEWRIHELRKLRHKKINLNYDFTKLECFHDIFSWNTENYSMNRCYLSTAQRMSLVSHHVSIFQAAFECHWRGLFTVSVNCFYCRCRMSLQWRWALLPQITKFMGPTWGPPGSCQPQMGPALAPRTLLSGTLNNLCMNMTKYYESHFYGLCNEVCCLDDLKESSLIGGYSGHKSGGCFG